MVGVIAYWQPALAQEPYFDILKGCQERERPSFQLIVNFECGQISLIYNLQIG